MPIYEYLCNDCETHFEKIVINKQQEIACPKCASKKASIQLSVFATANGGSSNGSSAKSSTSFSGGGGSCCGGGCGCH
jgi:putative FmdB family regulatory protein